jgi:hypothetical protein
LTKNQGQWESFAGLTFRIEGKKAAQGRAAAL